MTYHSGCQNFDQGKTNDQNNTLLADFDASIKAGVTLVKKQKQTKDLQAMKSKLEPDRPETVIQPAAKTDSPKPVVTCRNRTINLPEVDQTVAKMGPLTEEETLRKRSRRRAGRRVQRSIRNRLVHQFQTESDPNIKQELEERIKKIEQGRIKPKESTITSLVIKKDKEKVKLHIY